MLDKRNKINKEERAVLVGVVQKEQTEEETLALDLLAKIKVAGGANAKDEALFALDNELAKTPDDATLAQDVTVEKP